MKSEKTPQYERYQSVDAITSELKERLPWLFREGFLLDGKEGFDGVHFGCRTGPIEAKTVSNALHEAAHAIELTLLPAAEWKRRLSRPNFGMRITSYQTIGGEKYFEPLTMQPTERECRTAGIQLRLLEAAGYDTGTFQKDFVLLMRFMADWYQEGPAPLQDYLKPENHKWVKARTTLIQKSYKQHSLEDIQERWVAVTAQLVKKAKLKARASLAHELEMAS